ncbi:DEAD/DEAH box helicase [archaeon]|nr:DEAD/DEAH box helicase [archaeon]MBT6762269.1 DEAD/DEAH box helicase [archaeon]
MAMKYKGLTLDEFQEDAINAIEENKSVVVSAPTGSGKTLIADYIINKNKSTTKRIIYTAPIKALSNQKYKDFSKEYGGANVGLMTGDTVINPGARFLIMTTEIYRNMVLTGDDSVKDVAYVVFDEVHYINDPERGSVWEESVIYSPENVRFLCLSATIPNAEEFAAWIAAIKGHKVITVHSGERVVPLKHMFYDFELGITDLKSLNKHLEEVKDMPGYDSFFQGRAGRHQKGGRGGKGGRNGRNGKNGKGKRNKLPDPDHVALIKDLGPDRVPCLFFTFSRRDTQNKAKDLSRANVYKPDPKLVTFCREQMATWPKEILKLPTTQLLREALGRGIGFHHAGLLPALKEIVETMFSNGWIKVLYTTETFAVGINMPAKTVCFNDLRKYDGRSFRALNTKEYFQIAGRAGRRGIDPEGLVVSLIYRRHFNYKEVKKLTYKDVLPIQSQFKLSVNTTINIIDQHTPEEIEFILRQSFYSYQKFGDKWNDVPTERVLFRYNRIVKKLKKCGFLTEDNKLTDKGIFATKIFVNEIIISEIFATDLYLKMSDYQILLTLGSLCYEAKEKTTFKRRFMNKEYNALKAILAEDPLTKKEKLFESMHDVTALVHPMYNGKTFFDLLENTNLQEGDLIRFFGQVLDRVNQIRKAGGDHVLQEKMHFVNGLIRHALEGIYLV